jgi:SMC interacting uncharacterized protein involved in chromosome segregation
MDAASSSRSMKEHFKRHSPRVKCEHCSQEMSSGEMKRHVDRVLVTDISILLKYYVITMDCEQLGATIDREFQLTGMNQLLDSIIKNTTATVKHIEEINTMPNGLNFLNVLQQRFIDKQRSLLNEYETTTDRSKKDTIRQQLIKLDSEIKKKNDQIGELHRQIRSDEFKLQILDITLGEIDRITKERLEA